MKKFSSDYETRCLWISKIVATLVAFKCGVLILMIYVRGTGMWENRCNSEVYEKWLFVTLNQRVPVSSSATTLLPDRPKPCRAMTVMVFPNRHLSFC